MISPITFKYTLFDVIDINRICRLSHSNGTFILQTIITYSHILLSLYPTNVENWASS
jgi:hypothetical protein